MKLLYITTHYQAECNFSGQNGIVWNKKNYTIDDARIWKAR